MTTHRAHAARLLCDGRTSVEVVADLLGQLARVTHERDLARWAMLTIQERAVLAWL